MIEKKPRPSVLAQSLSFLHRPQMTHNTEKSHTRCAIYHASLTRTIIWFYSILSIDRSGPVWRRMCCLTLDFLLGVCEWFLYTTRGWMMSHWRGTPKLHRDPAVFCVEELSAEEQAIFPSNPVARCFCSKRLLFFSRPFKTVVCSVWWVQGNGLLGANL